MKNEQIGIPKCNKENKAKEICHNPQCKSFIFICQDENCECQKQHQYCIKVGLNTLLKVIQRKRGKPNNELNNYIEKVTDQMIDEISVLRDELLKRLEYLGLNEKQRKFLILMQSEQYQSISSKDLHDICLNLHIKESTSLEGSIKYIQKFWEQEKKDFNNFLQKLSKTVIKSFNAIQIKDLDSLIVGIDQFDNLTQMFNQKISSFKLLYRGSQNNFSIFEFRNKCNKKKNNLCLVKTEHGNIIGAYTPISWDSGIDSQYVNDPSLKTFIFSLTLKMKFVHFNQTNTTHHYTSWGPRFGTDGSCDFAIGENSNSKQTKCYANICNQFIPENPINRQNIDFIKQNFVGRGIKGTNKFKITEWEMFQLTFQ